MKAMKAINFERGKGISKTMGIGLESFINIEKIFIKIIHSSYRKIEDKGSLDIESGHKFFQKIVDETKIDWDPIFNRFPDREKGLKNNKYKAKIIFIGPREDGSGLRSGANPAYLRHHIAGKTIHYNGKFYDLPELRGK